MSSYAATYRTQEQPPQVKTYRAALYIRLSREDGDKAESDSVINQKKTLNKFVDDHPDIQIADYYIDDGWSGVNSNRPQFQRMLKDIEEKRVNCVIVKDSSRFGRNLSETDAYISKVFQRLNVRYITVNEGTDTGKKRYNSADFLNINMHGMINEFYVAENSDKIRSSLDIERERGEFIGAFAKYGYRKDPHDRHRLLIDEEAAEVVRLIYQLYLGGTGIRGIVRYLNDRGIPNPSTYKQQKGFNFRARSKGGSPLWGDKTVRRTLQDEMYIGDMVQGKHRKVSYKDKAIIACERSEWFRVEGTHEAIIRPEDFDQVQRMLRRSVKAYECTGEISLFAGLLYCADCGHAMIKKTNNNPDKTYVYYRCSTHCKCKAACTPHTIRCDKLYDTVLTTLRKMIEIAVDADEVLKEMRARKSADRTASLQSQLESKERELQRVTELLADLYPDYKSGILNAEQYRINKEKYERLQVNLAQSIGNLEESISDSKAQTQTNEFIEHFKRHGNIDRLTRPLLTELIDYITVNHDGALEITFNFTDAFQDALMITEKKYSA